MIPETSKFTLIFALFILLASCFNSSSDTTALRVVIQGDSGSKNALENLLKENPKVIDSQSGTTYSIQIIEPDPNIDYKIIIIEPDPNIKYTIRIIDPDTGCDTYDFSQEVSKEIMKRFNEKAQK